MRNWLFQVMSRLFQASECSSQMPSCSDNLNSLNGATVVLEEQPGLWQVEYAGSFWYAYSPKQSIFHEGDIVQVVGREGISLLIDKA